MPKRLTLPKNRLVAVTFAALALTLVSVTPAHAAYDETNCQVPAYGSCRTTWLVPAHSTQHWIRVMGDPVNNVWLEVYDATNGDLIYDRPGTGRWVTLNNVYASYYVVGKSVGGQTGRALIDNCTSGCHQRR
jgi:hypothetical protein